MLFKVATDSVVARMKVAGRCLDAVVFKRWQHGQKKFFKNVTIAQANGLYEVNLDNRKMKTPQGKILQISNEALAIAVATEWSTQKASINRPSMHLTGLCNTAQDNPLGRTKENLADIVTSFLETDTICCRQDEPVELCELQRNEWDPALNWFCKRFDVELSTSNDISGPVVSQRTTDTIKKHLLSHNFSALTGLHYAVEALKSVVLALAIVDTQMSVERAVSLSRLELEFQISRWGCVEWAHDIDLMDLRARVAAAILFVQLNKESWSSKRKSDFQSWKV